MDRRAAEAAFTDAIARALADRQITDEGAAAAHRRPAWRFYTDPVLGRSVYRIVGAVPGQDGPPVYRVVEACVGQVAIWTLDRGQVCPTPPPDDDPDDAGTVWLPGHEAVIGTLPPGMRAIFERPDGYALVDMGPPAQ